MFIEKRLFFKKSRKFFICRILLKNNIATIVLKAKIARQKIFAEFLNLCKLKEIAFSFESSLDF